LLPFCAPYERLNTLAARLPPVLKHAHGEKVACCSSDELDAVVSSLFPRSFSFTFKREPQAGHAALP